MARLLILRHGKTELVSETGRDFDRKLVERGKEIARIWPDTSKVISLFPISYWFLRRRVPLNQRNG